MIGPKEEKSAGPCILPSSEKLERGNPDKSPIVVPLKDKETPQAKMDATTETVKKGPGRPKKVWTEEELAAKAAKEEAKAATKAAEKAVKAAEKAEAKAVKAAEKEEAKAVKAALSPEEKKALREAKKAASAPSSVQEIRKQLVALLALLPEN